MSAPTLEARTDHVFISLEHLIRTGQRLEVLKRLEPQTDPRVLAIAVESVIGPGNRAAATVSQAIKRTREAIARLVRWLIATIKDLVSNYRIRTERLHGFLNDVDNTVREGVRAGWLKGERTQHINNLPIASALIRGPRVSYTAVREDLGKVESITRLVQDVLNQRAKANTAILREIGRTSKTDQVRALLTAHTPTSMVSRAPSAQTLAAIPLRASQRVKLSDALCGNKAIAFIDYDRDATLATYLPNAPALPPSPWAGSSYGYRFVEENPTLNMRAQGNAIFACLTAREIENMLALIRAQLGYIKRITNAVDDATKDLRRIERGVENLPLSHLRGLEQRLVHDYYLTGSRQDYTFGIDAMTYVFGLVFNSLMWVRVSLRQYQ